MTSTRSLTPVALALVLAAPVAAQDASPDPAALQATVDQWIEAWDAGDMDALGALYTEDADFEDVSGQRYTGRAAVQAAFAELNAGPYAGTKLTLEGFAARVVTPELAVSDARWTLSGVAEGDDALPGTGLSTVVMVKQGEEWKITAHRSRVAMTPPAE